MNLHKKVSGWTVVGLVLLLLFGIRFFVSTGTTGKTQAQMVESAASSVAAAASSAASRVSLSHDVSGDYLAWGKQDNISYVGLRIDLVHVQGNEYSGQLTKYIDYGLASPFQTVYQVRAIADDGQIQVSTPTTSCMGTYDGRSITCDLGGITYKLAKMTSQDISSQLQQMSKEADANFDSLAAASKKSATIPEQIPDGNYLTQEGSDVFDFVIKGERMALFDHSFSNGQMTKTKILGTVEYLGNHKFVFHVQDQPAYYGQITSDHGFYLAPQGDKVKSTGGDGMNPQTSTDAQVQSMVNQAKSLSN